MLKLIIIAGGKGTRLSKIASDIPKPMFKIGGKPVLEHQITLAREYGIRDIRILTGYLSEYIEEFFADGAMWGVNISYAKEQHPMGTAGCLKLIERELTEDFIVFYGDTIIDIDLSALINFHNKLDAIATLMVHPNDHPYDSDLLDMDENGRITAFYPKPRNDKFFYRNLVNAGLYILKPDILKYINPDISQDFGKDVFPQLLNSDEKLCAYLSCEYVKDMGTPERFKKVEDDMLSGKVKRLNLRNKQRAIFLDRDGVINKEVNFLSNSDDFELLPNVGEAIKKINKAGVLIIVVTNQPVIARGDCTFNELQKIHNKMDTLLGHEGAYIDRLYYCPHHPDKGFKGERIEYKIKCSCRKPAIGMIEKAVNDCNIDLGHSFMIGDATVDIKTGQNASLKTVLLTTGYGGKDRKYEAKPDYIFNDLNDAVNFVLNKTRL